jgi:hypothetical protein
MNTQKHSQESCNLLKKELATYRDNAEKMHMNVDNDLILARTELLNCQSRAKQILALIQQGERFQLRFNTLIGGAPVPLPRTGITEAIREIIDASPRELFTTSQIRLILKDRDFDTTPRNFRSSLSTALTRLGRIGFITVKKDNEGLRTFQKKEETTAGKPMASSVKDAMILS